MTLHFRYKSLKHSDGTISKVPLVPIKVIGKETLILYGLVDSGSDMCAVSKRVAELLGLSLSGKKEISFGVGGKAESVQSRMIVTIKQGNERHRLNLPVKIILSNHDFPVILGQEGFFDKFIIKFNKGENKFSLKKIRKILF